MMEEIAKYGTLTTKRIYADEAAHRKTRKRFTINAKQQHKIEPS
jgi:hypothetical protein